MNASGNQNLDAFGLLLNDYYSGVDGCEVIERDDGFLNVTDNMSMYFATFADWQPHVRALMESVRGRVLDVGAGPADSRSTFKRRGKRCLAQMSRRARWRSAASGACAMCGRRLSTESIVRWGYSTQSADGQQFRAVRQSPPRQVDAAQTQTADRSLKPASSASLWMFTPRTSRSILPLMRATGSGVGWRERSV